MVSDASTDSRQLWVEFAKITQQMIDNAVEEHWEAVAQLETKRQIIEEQINSLPHTQAISHQLGELIKACEQKNSELVALARVVKNNCQAEVSKLSAGKKVAAAYSL